MGKFLDFLNEAPKRHGYYNSPDDSLVFHIENRRNGRNLVSSNGDISIPYTNDNTLPSRLIANIFVKYKGYLKHTKQDMSFETYLKTVYDDTKDMHLSTVRSKEKEINNTGDGDIISFGKLELDGELIRLFKFKDDENIYMYNKQIFRFNKVKRGAIEKGEDGIYHVLNDKNGNKRDVKFLKSFLSLKDFEQKSEETRADEKMIKRWKQKEEKIAKNLNDIFKDSKRLIVNEDVDLEAKQRGGGNYSDIEVINNKSKKSFFIESKLNYSSSEYFKFHLILKGGKLYHRPDSKLTKSQRNSLDEIFGGNNETRSKTVIKILMGGKRGSEISQQIKTFYKNIKQFLKQTDEWLNGSNRKEVDIIRKEFFNGVMPLYTSSDDIQQIEFPTGLVELVKCFIQYIAFIKTVKENQEKVDESESYTEGLYNQLISNLNELLQDKKQNDVKKFVDEALKNGTDGRYILTYIYKSVISSVKSDKNDDYNLMLFKTHGENIIPDLVGKINQYYADIHRCRYIEIGTNSFTGRTEFNENTWHSNIYVLEPKNKKEVGMDPLCLMKNDSIKVLSIKKLKEINYANIFCQVSDTLDSFNLKFFLGSKANENPGSEDLTKESSSFEDLKTITLTSPLRF